MGGKHLGDVKQMSFTKGFPCESKLIHAIVKGYFLTNGNSPKDTQYSTFGDYKSYKCQTE